MKACPCDCSPTDFIKAVSVGEPSDIMRSAALIMGKNPLGGICGQTCPEKHCMDACVHDKFDSPVNIPAVQATIIEKAKLLNVMPKLAKSEPNGKKVAVIGSGPAGLGTAALLTQRGYAITIFEKEKTAGGMCNLIPDFRLDKNVLKTDIEWIMKLGNIKFIPGREINDPELLLADGFDAVVVAAGLWVTILPGIPNEDRAATAFDCSMIAMIRGADNVEIFALENLSEMPLGKKEMDTLIKSGIDVNSRIQVDEILCEDDRVNGISTSKVKLKKGQTFSLEAIETIPGSKMTRNDIDKVIIAIGVKPTIKTIKNPAIFFAGDCIEGTTTVVEASAAGKNAGEQVDAYLKKNDIPQFERNSNGCVKSIVRIPGYDFLPVDLKTDFFGRQISSPFLLSAAPPTDGFDQMKKAYEAGWPGAIMKTSFDSVPIHIPYICQL
jgi:NADPH-dependent glutamate synthase beta subunit-like oxidoreductase